MIKLTPSHWPLSVRVPLLVAALTIIVAVVISQIVLSRLVANQELSLKRLANAYLDGLSTAVGHHIVRQDIWETYDALDRSKQRYQGLPIRYVIAATSDGVILASTNPERFGVGDRIPREFMPNHAGEDIRIDEERLLGWLKRELKEEGITVGFLVAELSLETLIGERRKVLLTLLAFNTALTLLFAATGYLLVRRMIRPASVLTGYLERLESGHPETIPEGEIGRQGPEFQNVFRRFNAMVAAVNERAELTRRLAEEEKLTLIGKLASGVAHEVNNPLGGMMNAVDTLRIHGANPEVRETSLGLLDRGLRGIRDVVRGALVIYKGDPEQVELTRQDIDDLALLVKHRVERRKLQLTWRNDLGERISIDGGAIRQAVLNLLLNACEVTPVGGVVAFHTRCEAGDFVISITDQGGGLPPAVRRLFETASPDMVPPRGLTGLGAWTAARLVARLSGRSVISEESDGGTRIEIRVPVERKDIHAA